MYAHVSTYRLGTSEETCDDVWSSAETGDPISDQSARTIASWWHWYDGSCSNITALSRGRPFDTDELADEIRREIKHPDDRGALLVWLDSLCELLTA
ncbi:hypothetical protein QI633_07845 [Nocardioides sp. QY071]|uniref:hypothetical protein n=1 Tax=Nocardioides sp. QY071 TaxID=3044187 RepID=UPI00249BC5C3|nr:hypothetical protein [Nocardioides sp. QY071]WGY03668.1 hypothetical protein QI633_07845 [Nocardioides sp. QY071]